MAGVVLRNFKLTGGNPIPAASSYDAHHAIRSSDGLHLDRLLRALHGMDDDDHRDALAA